jgi:hypothetical protein
LSTENTPGAFIEYTIKVKDERKTLSEKFHAYNEMMLSLDNKTLMSQVQEVVVSHAKGLEDFREAPEVVVTARMIVQS